MAYFYVKKSVTREEKVLEKIVCDWCGKEFKSEEEFNGEKGIWTQNEFEFHLAEGNVYPESDARVHYRTELCHECRFKLLREMKKLGINIFETDEEW